MNGRMLKLGGLAAALALVLAACTPIVEEMAAEYINLSVETLNFPVTGGTKSAVVETNVSNISIVSAPSVSWCQPTFEDGKLQVKMLSHTAAASRSVTITLKGKTATALLMVTQAGTSTGPADEFITVNQPTRNFDYYLADEAEVGTTNVVNINYTPNNSWCQPIAENGKLKVRVSTNENTTQRSVTLQLYGSNTTTPLAVLAVTQAGKTIPNIPDPGNDVKLTVQSATASSSQPGEGIEKSHDGNMSTIYHSNYSTSTTFPVTLTYNFTNPGSMDYLLYRARTTGTNGKFQTLELWVNDGAGLVKYGDYNFNGGDTRVTFEPPLNNPSQIQFKVLTGAGGFASCAEMEFYRKAPLAFDCLSIFTDLSCSEIKPGVTRSTIQAIPDAFFKDLALKIFLGQYASEFRVQEYRAWEHPDKKAATNRTRPYSVRDNPTGIYVRQDEDLIVLVASLHGKSVSVLSQDLITDGNGGSNGNGMGLSRTYSLTPGFNKIRTTAKGLLYVQYYSDDGIEAPKVKINFATGLVNGYFDAARHQSSDWTRLLNNALAEANDFDLVGERAHLTFPIAKFKTDTPDGAALVAEYDKMVRLEQEFMGLGGPTDKYAWRRYANRMYFHLDYTTTSHMYAQSYHTAYSVAGMNEGVLKPHLFKTTALWGPAHELGHMHQTDPYMVWAGMTEVTVNIYAMHVHTSFGNTSRLTNQYTNAFNFLGGETAHIDFKYSNNSAALEWQLVPFWQLKLYLVDVLGKQDFYKDLIYKLATDTSIPGVQTSVNNGLYQLNFVRRACEAAELNLLDFFEDWGFLTPVNRQVNDYGNYNFNITQEMVDSFKAEINAKGYANPPRDFTRITDANVNTYR